MNQRELVNLVFGIILIVGLFIGFTWTIDNVQADDYNNTLYQFDIYSDHHHFTPTPCATFTPEPAPPTPLPPTVTPSSASTNIPIPTSTFTAVPASTNVPTPTPYPNDCPTPTPPTPPPPTTSTPTPTPCSGECPTSTPTPIPWPTPTPTPCFGECPTSTPTTTPWPTPTSCSGECPTLTPSPLPPTPIFTSTPLPTATPAPVVSIITPTEGGSLLSNDTDNSTYFEFDPGVVDTETIVTYFYASNDFPLKPNNLRSINRSFSFEATQNGTSITQFNQPYNITISYPTNMTVDPSELSLYRLEGNDWVVSDITIVSWVDELVISTNRLGEFAVMWNDNRVHLPFILK